MATETLLLSRSLDTSNSAPLRVAILGFGTVGRAVAGILSNESFPDLELTQVFNRDVARKRDGWSDGDVQWTENISDVLAGDVDVVVETMGGIEPARQWVTTALKSGKSVVTANKQLIARFG